MTRRSNCSAELRDRRERKRRPLLGAVLLGSTSLGLFSWLAASEGVATWALAMPSAVLLSERPQTNLRDPRAPVRSRRVDPSRSGDETFTLLVVDHAGIPVAGAEVACMEISRLMQQNVWASAAQLDLMLGMQSWSARADDTGRIVLRRPRDKALVAARSGKRFGLVLVTEAREVRLELFDDAELAVELVDDRGRPVARAGVVLRAQGEVMRSKTNELGQATFTHAGWLTASHPGAWSVAPEGLFKASAAVALPPDMPQEPIRLYRPPCGAVLVALGDLDGKPYRRSVEVALAGYEPISKRRVGKLEQESLRGFARFESVEIGLSVRATTTLRHILIESYSQAPAEQGAEARLELGFEGDQRTFVRGRAFAADGEPIRASHLGVAWEGDWKGRRLTWTDDHGVFVVALGTGIAASDEARGLRLRSMRETSGTLDLAAALASGVHDVGNVRLVAQP